MFQRKINLPSDLSAAVQYSNKRGQYHVPCPAKHTTTAPPNRLDNIQGTLVNSFHPNLVVHPELRLFLFFTFGREKSGICLQMFSGSKWRHLKPNVMSQNLFAVIFCNLMLKPDQIKTRTKPKGE